MGDNGISAEYTYTLDIEPRDDGTDGRLVVLRELTCEEFEGLAKAITADTPNAGWELTQRGLRHSLIKDGKDELTYRDLVGPLLARRFRTRHMVLLRQAWESIHTPSQGDQERVKMMRVAAG